MRTLRSIATVVSLSFAGCGVDASPPSESVGTVSAKRIELKDASGNVRIEMFGDAVGGPLIRMLDSGGLTRATLRAGTIGPSLALFDQGGKRRLSLDVVDPFVEPTQTSRDWSFDKVVIGRQGTKLNWGAHLAPALLEQGGSVVTILDADGQSLVQLASDPYHGLMLRRGETLYSRIAPGRVDLVDLRDRGEILTALPSGIRSLPIGGNDQEDGNKQAE